LKSATDLLLEKPNEKMTPGGWFPQKVDMNNPNLQKCLEAGLLDLSKTGAYLSDGGWTVSQVVSVQT